MTTLNPPTPADQLHALYQLSDRVVPGGFAWPESIVLCHGKFCYQQRCGDSDTTGEPYYVINDIQQNHTLAIVERAAEDHLRGRGWGSVFVPEDIEGEVWYNTPALIPYKPLPAALAAENGRGG